MESSYLYIIECKNGSLYTGITSDLLRRYHHHLAGKGSKYCRAFKVKVIKGAWQFPVAKSKLLSLEMKIKKLTKEKKLHLLANPSQMEIYLQQLELDLTPMALDISDFLKKSCPCSSVKKCNKQGICSQCLEVHLKKLQKPPLCVDKKGKWLKEVAQNLNLENLQLLEEWIKG